MKPLLPLLLLLLLPAPAMTAATKPIDTPQERTCMSIAAVGRLYDIERGVDRRKADAEYLTRVLKCKRKPKLKRKPAPRVSRYIPIGRRGAPTSWGLGSR